MLYVNKKSSNGNTFLVCKYLYVHVRLCTFRFAHEQQELGRGITRVFVRREKFNF